MTPGLHPPRPADTARPCRYCQHYGEMRTAGVWCLKFRQIHTLHLEGCSQFTREPGSDDDLGSSSSEPG